MPELQKDFIYNLIGKKLSGQISIADNDSLLDWIDSSKEAIVCYEDLKMSWGNIQFSSNIKNLYSPEEIRDEIWEKAF